MYLVTSFFIELTAAPALAIITGEVSACINLRPRLEPKGYGFKLRYPTKWALKTAIRRDYRGLAIANAQRLKQPCEENVWQFEPVDNKWRLLNAASGTYMLAPDHTINEGVVGGTPPDVFTFIDSDGSYQIQLVDEPLVLYLGDSTDGTQRGSNCRSSFRPPMAETTNSSGTCTRLKIEVPSRLQWAQLAQLMDSVVNCYCGVISWYMFHMKHFFLR
ncbi:predicted protein [Postia placenta Mad-698-R]|nr:predicted protein [Postia placenta Mad-698-R]